MEGSQAEFTSDHEAPGGCSCRLPHRDLAEVSLRPLKDPSASKKPTTSPAGCQPGSTEGDVNGLSSRVAFTWYMYRCGSWIQGRYKRDPIPNLARMQPLSSIFFAAVFLFFPLCHAQNACASSSNCLNTAEASNIALRYVSAFETDAKGQGTGVALVPSTFAPNFTYYDEGVSFGVPGPYYHNRSELTAALEGSGYTGTLSTNVKYTVLDLFASCNMILLRWQSNSQATNATNM